ncbi:hypothetical protein MKX01_019505 [Papaver californicum]|nr:hypothetical protein MKX01_019505 [Papaver californicum]
MAGSEGPVVFCLHGGGFSGLSFALSASKVKDNVRVVAMDLRRHGKSSTEDDSDLSIETLRNDVLAVINAMYGDSPPAIVLVGHSLGGSVAVHVAAKRAISKLAGLVVVDGTAIASLMHMQKILSGRVQHFPTYEKAVEWSVRGGFLRNIESACISVPSTLKYDDSKNWGVFFTAIDGQESYWCIKCLSLVSFKPRQLNFMVNYSISNAHAKQYMCLILKVSCSYIYRTPLEESERYWRGWYEGLSDLF